MASSPSTDEYNPIGYAGFVALFFGTVAKVSRSPSDSNPDPPNAALVAIDVEDVAVAGVWDAFIGRRHSE